MNDDYIRGLRDGHHASTMAALVRACRSEENNAWFWLALSIVVFGLNMITLTPSTWIGLVIWGVCILASARRIWKNHHIRRALLAEITRWKQDQPEAAAVLHNMNSRANTPRNNNKGEEV